MNLTFTNNTLPTGEIKIPEEFSTPRLEKLKKCMDFYRANGYFDRQIIVDSDKTLHDGYCAYITAVLMGAETVDVLMVGEKKAKKEPANESKPEPVKLYCVKDYRGNLTRGKIYEVKDGFMRYDDGSKAFMQWMDIAEDIKESWLFEDGYLVPLVQRPAKVWEWVYIVDADPAFCNWYNGNYKNGDVLKITSLPPADRRGAGVMSGKNYVIHSEYLVLDGYHGDSE